MSLALLGRQTPRIQLAPPCAHNGSGDDVVEFARRIGVPLDLWQQLALRNGTGRCEDGSLAAFEVCVICQRQNGKGSITDVLELYALFVLGLPVVIHSAHRLETSRKAFRVIRGIIERNPDLTRRCKPINPSDEHIETIGGCRLEFRTRTKSGGRGLTADLLVLDEALELTDEQIAAIVPTLAARPGAQLWYTSTVPQFAEQHLCKVRASALAGEPRLAYVEWGADRGATSAETARILADPVAQAEANPAYGIRLTAERLADLRRILGDTMFATECMGIWPETTAGALFDPKQWAAMRLDGAKRLGDLTLSVDVTPLLDHGSIGLYCPTGAVPGGGGELEPTGKEHVQLVDYREHVAWMPDRLAELVDVLDPIAVVLDSKNGAHAMIDAFREAWVCRCEETGRDPGEVLKVPEDPEKPLRGQILVLETRDVVDAVGQFVQAFRVASFQHIGQEPLNAAIKNVKPRQIGDAGQIAYGRKASEVDIGPAQVVTQARYGHHAWVGLVTSDYDVLDSVW